MGSARRFLNSEAHRSFVLAARLKRKQDLPSLPWVYALFFLLVFEFALEGFFGLFETHLQGAERFKD